MAKTIRSTLLSDGSSDQLLLPIIDWTLARHCRTAPAQPTVWADLRFLKNPPRSLPERIVAAMTYYTCDILFVHRDAENQPPGLRHRQIDEDFDSVRDRLPEVRHVRVVPVRMTEAWLLADLNAIVRAAGARTFGTHLQVPPVTRLEELPDPKTELHDLLKQISGLSGRKLDRFDVKKACYRIAEHIESFEHLMSLSAFSDFYSDTGNACHELLRNTAVRVRD